MRLTYGKRVKIDHLDEGRRNQLGVWTSRQIQKLVSSRFQENHDYQVQMNNNTITVSRGTFKGRVKSVLGQDMIVVNGQSQHTALLTISADCENTALESAYQEGEDLAKKYQTIGLLTLGSGLAILTTLFTAAIANKVYFIFLLLSFGVGAAVGSVAGKSFGEKKIQEARTEERRDPDIAQAKSDWNGFIMDLVSNFDNLKI